MVIWLVCLVKMNFDKTPVSCWFYCAYNRHTVLLTINAHFTECCKIDSAFRITPKPPPYTQ